jgi:hypothetical protein
MSLTIQSTDKPTSTEDCSHTTIEVFIPKKYNKERLVYLFVDDEDVDDPKADIRIIITKNFLMDKPGHLMNSFAVLKKDDEEASPDVPSVTKVLGLKAAQKPYFKS